MLPDEVYKVSLILKKVRSCFLILRKADKSVIMYALMDVERALVFVNVSGRGYNWIKLRFYLWLNKGFFSLSSSYNFNTDTGWLSGNFNTENSFSFGFLCLFKKSNAPNFFLAGVTQERREQASWAFMESGLLGIIDCWCIFSWNISRFRFFDSRSILQQENKKCWTSPGASLIVWSHHHVKLRSVLPISNLFSLAWLH